MKTLQFKIVALAVLAVLALPTVALGASSDEGYGGPNNVVSGVQTDNDEGPTSSPEPESETAGVQTVSDTDDSDVLPFTGTDLLIMAASGGLLLMFGFGLRRLTRRPSL
jgi:hypothetical protein